MSGRASVMKVMKNVKKPKLEIAQMDDTNRALCYALRNPPKGTKPMTLSEIVKKVKKTDGTRPTFGGVAHAVKTFHAAKKPVGRPKGCRKTTKADDNRLMKTFHTVRPPGRGIDSRRVHKALPKTLQKKMGRRTIRRRLAEKGFTPQLKMCKQDFKESQVRKRMKFQQEHDGVSAAGWKQKLQGVGDFKDFTYYPQHMRSKFLALRAPWTYMTKAERKKPEFQRPKRWFPKQDWKQVKKQKVFGLTTSNGKTLCFLVPKPFTSKDWALEMKNRVVPFLKRTFPNKRSFQILLDGEGLFYAPDAKKAMEEGKVSVLANWPKYSPDLNPQENVWAWSEERLRAEEEDDDSFEDFQTRVLRACHAYPYGEKLVGGMAKRMQILSDRKGANIGK